MDYASSILGFLPGGRRSTGISQLLDKLEAYLSPAQVERVREAYDFGAEKHQGQKRVSGEPYITHPVAVADILADLRLDADTLVAAILHDVIEDTPTGVSAGVAAGMTVYGYCGLTPARRLTEAGAHCTFDRMERLPALLLGR